MAHMGKNFMGDAFACFRGGLPAHEVLYRPKAQPSSQKRSILADLAVHRPGISPCKTFRRRSGRLPGLTPGMWPGNSHLEPPIRPWKGPCSAVYSLKWIFLHLFHGKITDCIFYHSDRPARQPIPCRRGYTQRNSRQPSGLIRRLSFPVRPGKMVRAISFRSNRQENCLR